MCQERVPFFLSLHLHTNAYTEIILLIGLLPIGTVIYLLLLNYNNVYKKYQAIFQAHQMLDTPEVNDPITLKLTSGQVPTWLNGVMYRIGPGRFNIQQNDGSTFSIKHAFDGLPFMHRFEIHGQTQTLKYNSRMLCKSLEHKIKDKSYKGLIYFGHIPLMSFPQWIYHFLARLDSMVLRPRPRSDHLPDGQAVGVTATPNFPLPAHWNKDNRQHVLVSKTDANVLQKIHAETLEPERIFTYTTFDKKLKGQFSAAHHQWDPVTKETYNFTLAFAPQPRMIVFSTSESGQVTVLADITHRSDGSLLQAPYIHSLWLTKNYVIVPECPLTYQDKGKNMLLNGSILSSMSWVENTPTYFHVISRSGGLVASIPAPAFFTFHVGNAFDSIDPHTGDVILTLDSASFSDGDILGQVYTFGTPHRKGPTTTATPKSSSSSTTTRLNGMTYSPKPQNGFGDYMRYKLNLTRSKLISTDMLVKNLEFPRFNQEYSMKSNCEFVYGCELKGATEKMDETGGLMKLNLSTGHVLRYEQEGFNCSEPIFVPNSSSLGATKEEDDGVLLTLANNFDCCYLIVLDAKEMKELARFRIGQFVAVTFHGSYVDHDFESVNVN